MKVICGCIIFTCFVTYAFCAVISEAKKHAVLNLEELNEDCLVDDKDVPENSLLNLDKALSNGSKILGSAKKKRCPR